MDIFITIIAFFGILVVVILVHELGHFATAKLSGIKVEEFGLGFPPRLLGFKRGETTYSLNLIPLGGFCRMAGEEDPKAPRSLAGKSVKTRLLVLSSGSIMNALLPILLFSVAFMIPTALRVGDVVVNEVAPDSPAEQAGIMPGDTILKLDGRKIRNLNDLAYNTHLNLGAEVTLHLSLEVGDVVVNEVVPNSPAERVGIIPGDTILKLDGHEIRNSHYLVYYIHLNLDNEVTLLIARGDAQEEVSLMLRKGWEVMGIGVELQNRDDAQEWVSLVPRWDPPEGEGAMGVLVELESETKIKESYPFWEAIPKGTIHSVETFILFKNEIMRWFIAKEKPQLAGPIGIAELTGEAAKSGFGVLLEFTAFLSMNLAIINLLPIPGLDGGRIIFVAIEGIRRGKRISPRREGLVHLIGFMILILIIVLITYQDILRIIRGESLIP
jgi:regulator of sigma E protease